MTKLIILKFVTVNIIPRLQQFSQVIHIFPFYLVFSDPYLLLIKLRIF